MKAQNLELKRMQMVLEGIINASEEAISVVDENGLGMMINPAYTRLTGLTPKDILGKPADEDIAEGKSVHMQVLKTRKAIRGAHLKVGPKKKQVMINAAPVIVDEKLMGSVAVIHDLSELKQLTDELSTARHIIRKLASKYTFADIIGQSQAMQIAIESAKNASRVPATVLLRGESGTGKELFAHAIHHAGPRRDKPFIRVNCAAIVDSLFESELFGYEDGAFTGARSGGKRGLFEEACGGTLFFDEVSELSMNTQAKLLRVLQEKELVKVGGYRAIPVDVRIIAATHVDLVAAVDQGRFRHDLFYRLNVMPVFIPPLRRRPDDIEMLTEHIVRKFNQEFGRNITDVLPETHDLLRRHPWPGNVRELENILAQTITQMRFFETTIRPEHLPDMKAPFLQANAMKNGSADRVKHTMGTDGAFPMKHLGDDDKTARMGVESSEMEGCFEESDLKTLLARTEAAHIRRVLSKNGGNRERTAKDLGISIRSLYLKLGKYGVKGRHPI